VWNRLGYASRVCDLAALDRTDLSTLQRDYGYGLAIEGDEFHLECFTSPVDMHDRADVPRGKPLAGQIGREYNPVMFLDHADSSSPSGGRIRIRPGSTASRCRIDDRGFNAFMRNYLVGVDKARTNILRFQPGVALENRFRCVASDEHAQDMLDGETLPPDDRLPMRSSRSRPSSSSTPTCCDPTKTTVPSPHSGWHIRCLISNADM